MFMINDVPIRTAIDGQGNILDFNAYAAMRYQTAPETYEGYSPTFDALYDSVPLEDWEFEQLRGKEGKIIHAGAECRWRVREGAFGGELQIIIPFDEDASRLCEGVGHDWEEMTEPTGRKCRRCQKAEIDPEQPPFDPDEYDPAYDAMIEAEQARLNADCARDGHEWHEERLSENAYDMTCLHCGHFVQGYW